MPGAYKVIIYFLIQKLHSFSTLGLIASWQTTAQILGYFTAIGWSSLILVRVSKASSSIERIRIFNNLTTNSIITLIPFFILIKTTILLLGWHQNSFQISLWLAAWTIYQTSRHYFIATKEYRKALYLDTAIISLSAVTTFAPEKYLSTLLALSMLLCGVITSYIIQNRKIAPMLPICYEMKGLEFGLSNFLSGGIGLSFIPLAAWFEGKEFAGILSLFLSLAGIALLLPRAISLNHIPRISRALENKASLPIALRHLRKQITQSNIITTLACLLISSTILYCHPQLPHPTQTVIIFILIIFQNFLSNQCLVDANLLMINEKSKTLLKINSYSSIIFFSSTTLLHILNIENPFLHLCAITTTISAYRLYQTKRLAGKLYDRNTTI